VVAGIAAITLLALVYAALNLGVNMDNKTSLLSQDLPSEVRARAFEKHFPLLSDALLVVVDGASNEQAREGARRLAARLASRPDLAHSVYAPEVDPFFERHALLYRKVDALETLADQLARFQPMIAELSADPHITTLAHVIEQAIDAGGKAGLADELASLLRYFGAATVAVYAERPLYVSWSEMLMGDAGPPRATIVVDPVLDFDALLPAGRAIQEIRRVAKDEGLVRETGFRVRITGYPALNDEEMRGMGMDVGFAGIFSFAMVLVLMTVALRSWRIVAAAATTLIVGLIWTAAYAAATVGKLNVVSIAFAVLFIGLGVDFAIHLGMHYVEALRDGRDHEEAMLDSVEDVGSPLLLCTLTTAIGFFSFIPTDYKGVAELGEISGVGMFIILLLTLTLFPALLTRRLRLPGPPKPGLRPWGGHGRARPRLVLGIALLVTLVAIAISPLAHFDSNVVRMRNPNTESVRTWDDLLAAGTASPWYIDILAPNLDQAEALGKELAGLDLVSQTLTLGDYVPSDQADKLDVLADLAFLLDVPPAPPSNPPELSPTGQVAALRALRGALDSDAVQHGRSRGAAAGRLLQVRLDRFLERVARDGDPQAPLHELDKSLMGGFPAELAELHLALDPDPITLENLPKPLVARMLSSDGSARLQVFPRDDLSRRGALNAFVTEVQAVVPEATGLPVNVVEFGRATSRSLIEAVAIAVGLIAALLFTLWQRPADILRALAPLVLAGAWTVGCVVLLRQSFNFVNVIALPLLVGIGVDSGIHLVGRARRGLPPEVSITDTPTARAVFYSAATTLISFGSLAFSGHRGIASLGVLLVVGMSCTLVANLVVLPALLPQGGAGRIPA